MDMARPLLDPVGPTLGRRTDPLGDRAAVDLDPRDVEGVAVHVGRLLLGVGDRRAQDLLEDGADLLPLAEAQDGQGLADGALGDEVGHEPALLGAHAHEPGHGVGEGRGGGRAHVFPTFSCLAVLEVWPLKWRVGENSPSLCPTMFSVTNTGMNFRPLWTPMVMPTISGMIVDRRDQVLTTWRLAAGVDSAWIFSRRWPSMKGPLRSDLLMVTCSCAGR